MDQREVGETEDLATLVNLTEDILLNEIKARYCKDKIYTYVGDILVAVNPFKPLDVYCSVTSHRYRNIKKSTLPPHIFATADATYQAMINDGEHQSQCILISGESGAGKTESTKLIIKQLIDHSKGTSQLEQQILQVNPLLEAFGNAQTLMNDNSSRFGKFIQLKFLEGQIIGAKISEYLLEKTRVVRQSPGEENFHMFYYMLAGLVPEQFTKYQVDPNAKYRYISNGTSIVKTAASRLKSSFEDVINAMDMVGFMEQEQEDMLSVLAGVLNLGNMEFDNNSEDAATLTDRTPLNRAATLIGIDSQEIGDVLTYSETVTRGEVIRRNYTKHQAEDARDAMAKAIYGRMFGWIVNKINQLLAPRDTPSSAVFGEIGILDIFGFEHFKHNSFEQACINLANEQLQFFFNKHIFMMEQEEYRKEGVDWMEIKFVDNQPLLDLFMARPVGLLSLLDEECFFPKATDHSFVDKLNKNFAGNANYMKSTNTLSNNFTIAHYAGKVMYNSDGWLEKNRDTLPGGVNEMLQRSTNSLISLIFKGTITRTGTLALQGRRSRKSTTTRKAKQGPIVTGRKHNKITLGGQFKTSLQILMERMTTSTPHFIRCIKPNQNKAPDSFDDVYVAAQLLYTGMLETTKIRREGFAIRPKFSDFVRKYKILLLGTKLTECAVGCQKILNSADLKGYYIGKTKIFLKYWHLESLADRIQQISESAVHIQRVARGFLSRQRVKRHRLEAERQRKEMEKLLQDVQSISLKNLNKQEQVKSQDKDIPKGFFHVTSDYETVVLPPAPTEEELSPPPPVENSKQDKRVTIQAAVENEADESDESEGDVLEDEFVPVQTKGFTKYGASGTRAASVRWFKETQSQKLQKSQGVFYEWFHGIITRRQSEELLQHQAMGCFLIRVSESRFGYSLSFRTRDRCRHYMIEMTASGKYVVVGEPKVHKALSDIVAHHQQVPISNYPGVLTRPCGQEDGQCDYSDLVSTNSMYHQLETGDSEDLVSIYHYDDAPQLSKQDSAVYSMVDDSPRLPDRNYGYTGLSRNQTNAQKKKGRPLPREPPQEAYTSLLKNQRDQNAGKVSRSRFGNK